jgi:preprotein translocase subunit SecA
MHLHREKHEAKYKNLYKQIEELQLKETLTGKGNQPEQTAVLRYSRVSQKKPGKVGRNQLCMCGSGKKYKKCHGIQE